MDCFLVKTTIETFITMVLERQQNQESSHTSTLGRFNQMFIMLFELIVQEQSLFILS
ncbi:Uncharacterised protein [Klebsiella pneumoniae]|uniref:Uncharacterized protein n=1 Tax=Klebsiella pneumoniae TaxID=573 RepID=A0A377TK28_KLEPN|nr:Uncharacterised protein [Klebsiella pneumoniae]